MNNKQVKSFPSEENRREDKLTVDTLTTYVGKIDVYKLNLYPFFDLDEKGIPFFKEVKEIEEIIKNINLDDIKECFDAYSFQDYYFTNSNGTLLAFLINNQNFNEFCRNMLLNNSKYFYYDHLLSYKYQEVLTQKRELIKKQQSEMMSQIQQNQMQMYSFYKKNFEKEEVSDNEIDFEAISLFFKSNKKIEIRLKTNYFLILIRSYLQFKELFNLEGSSCLNYLRSEFIASGEKNNINFEKIKWIENQDKIDMNVTLLVLFEALKEAGYLTYGKENLKTSKLFEGLNNVLQGFIMIGNKNNPKSITSNNISKIKGEIKGRGDDRSQKVKKFDYYVLQNILKDILSDLATVSFDRKDVKTPSKIKK